MTLNSATHFEKQIKRIHDLLEKKGSKITWDDHIPDPDNPLQNRQIDITIQRGNKLTLVECRMRSAKQNVTWIEELIGRKLSLKADAVIAVSASGFSGGAIKKAKKFGIILRDILSLTEEEISNWGCQVKVWLTFLEYENVNLTFMFKRKWLNKISQQSINKFIETDSHKIYQMINLATNNSMEKNTKQISRNIEVEIKSKSILEINKVPVELIKLKCSINLVKQNLNTTSVVAYDSPGIGALERNVFIEAIENGSFEITNSNNKVSLTFDLSKIEIPINSKFRFVDIDHKRTVYNDKLYIIGLPKDELVIDNPEVGFDFI